MESLGKERNLTFIEYLTAFDPSLQSWGQGDRPAIFVDENNEAQRVICLMLPSLQRGGSGVLRL